MWHQDADNNNNNNASYVNQLRVMNNDNNACVMWINSDNNNNNNASYVNQLW